MTVILLGTNGAETSAGAALGFANLLRALQGAEPVAHLSPGGWHDTSTCPIARTATVEGSDVTWSVGPVSTGFGSGGVEMYRVETPPKAREFMAGFDAGLPEFVLEAA